MDSYSDYSLMEYLLPWWKYLLKLPIILLKDWSW